MKGWREDKKAQSGKEYEEKQFRRLEEAGYELEEARSEWENQHDERMA